MSRPRKAGISYFPLDTDFFENKKVRRLTRAFGATATSVLVNLLCTIYKDKGYYMRWDDDTLAFVADELCLKVGTVREIVVKAIQVGFFNANMANLFGTDEGQAKGDYDGILTSVAIQEQYFDTCKRSKRSEVCYDARFLLISMKPYEKIINSGENLVNSGENLINSGESTQRKVKESKVYTTTSKDELSYLFNAYVENGFGTVSGLSKEMILDDVDTYCIEWCKAAMEVAITRNKRSWSYVRGILKRWQSEYNLSDKPWEVEAVGTHRQSIRIFKTATRAVSSNSDGTGYVDWANDPDHF
ncbi:Lin1244/Lin1753 domain-containing protein [Veillonella criceti]|uniref:DnaD domain protein n=1 Tax=Veillonella criceti TaxID=103891 RepID=A0A380NLA5_9FIRM|nr:Lin1244/Lin1753 domain-containing protein [Veillonella criceti]SUP42424.1 DnaD domain protein [Veillonella criceti]